MSFPRYFTYLVECKDPKACTVVLRGASKDILNEVERNLHDAMAVARNVFFSPSLLPGGGATEMALSVYLSQRADALGGTTAASTASSPTPAAAPSGQATSLAAIQRLPYKAIAQALEVIPRTLIENCGASAIRVLTQLRVRFHPSLTHPAFPSCIHDASDTIRPNMRRTLWRTRTGVSMARRARSWTWPRTVFGNPRWSKCKPSRRLWNPPACYSVSMTLSAA